MSEGSIAQPNDVWEPEPAFTRVPANDNSNRKRRANAPGGPDSEISATAQLSPGTLTKSAENSGEGLAQQQRNHVQRSATPPQLAYRPNILDELVPVIEQMGSVGEIRLTKLMYLQLTSRVMSRPISLLVKAPSSAGKNWTVARLVRLFPKSAYYMRTGLSPKSLAYAAEDLSHRIIIVAEASGFANGEGAYFLRSLISEGRVDHQTVQDGEGKTLSIKGPVGLLTASTAITLDTELETRCWTVPVDDSPEQTRRIMRAHAKAANRVVEEPDLGEWLKLQEWIEHAEHRVVVPYAEVLVEEIPPTAIRLRRDLPALLELIKVVAVLHQASRKRTEEGAIIATIEDYAIVRELVGDLLSEVVDVAVSDAVRETVLAVRALHEEHGEAEIEKRIAGMDEEEVSEEMHWHISRKPQAADDLIMSGLIHDEAIKRRILVSLTRERAEECLAKWDAEKELEAEWEARCKAANHNYHRAQSEEGGPLPAFRFTGVAPILCQPLSRKPRMCRV